MSKSLNKYRIQRTRAAIRDTTRAIENAARACNTEELAAAQAQLATQQNELNCLCARSRGSGVVPVDAVGLD